MTQTCLLVDVGNTRTHAALSGPEGWRRVDLPNASVADLAGWLGDPAPAAIGVIAVNPPVLARLLPVLERARARVVRVFRDARELPLRELLVRTPETVGMDRLMNVLGARSLLPHGPHLVLDFGTALTVSALDAEDRFLGGAIAPGLRLMARALRAGTAALPDLDEIGVPEGAIGKDTREAIESGVWHALLGAARELIRGSLAHPALADATVWATGGDASRFASHLPEVARVDPDLSLRGVRLALAHAKLLS